jgi:hypothetical protein
VLLPTGSSGNGMTVQQELVPGRESCGRDIRITFHDLTLIVHILLK